MSYSGLGLARLPVGFSGGLPVGVQGTLQSAGIALGKQGYDRTVSFIYEKIEKDPELKQALSPLTKLQLEGVKMASVGVAKAILAGGDVSGAIDSLADAVQDTMVEFAINGAIDALAAAGAVLVPGVGTALSAAYVVGKSLFRAYEEKQHQDCQRVWYADNIAKSQISGRRMGVSSHSDYMAVMNSTCPSASSSPVKIDPSRIYPAEYFAKKSIVGGSKQIDQMPSLGNALIAITELTPEDFQALRWYQNAKKVSKDLEWTWKAVFGKGWETRATQLFEKQFATSLFSPNFNLNDLMSKSDYECGENFPKQAHANWQKAVRKYMKKEGYDLLIPEMDGNAAVSGRLGFEVAQDVFGAAPMSQFEGKDIIPRSTYFAWKNREAPIGVERKDHTVSTDAVFFEISNPSRVINEIKKTDMGNVSTVTGYYGSGSWSEKAGRGGKDYGYFTSQFLMPPPVWDISKKDQQLFKQIRQAIQSQHKDMGGNGGDELWPLYLDLLVQQFRKGKINDTAVCLLISRKLLPKGCFDFNHQVLYDLYGLLDTWSVQSNPSNMYRTAREELEKKIAQAKDALADYQAKQIANLKIGPQTAETIIKKAKAKKLKSVSKGLTLKISPKVMLTLAQSVKVGKKSGAIQKPGRNTLLIAGAGIGVTALLGYLYLRKR